MIEALDRLHRELRLLGRVLARSLPEFALIVVIPVCTVVAAFGLFGWM